MKNTTTATDYKNTLNLPQTRFPMKADLAKRELAILKQWERQNLYAALRAQAILEKRKKFILHDGPPYANGHIHIGHALNKLLKDMVLKYQTLSGYDTPFVPGWDCHGLPIELNVEKKLAKKKQSVSPAIFRQLCRDYATSQVAIQRQAFQRLGIQAAWNRPYLTMDHGFEANIIRTLAKVIENGHLQRGQKPVHWCVACQSALAEAELIYQEKSAWAIDVRFQATATRDFIARMGEVAKIDPTLPLSVVIWTTTPWTLPANEAVALHADISYSLLWAKTANGPEYLLIASDLMDAVLSRWELSAYRVQGTCLGKSLAGIYLLHPFLDKKVPIVLAEHVTTQSGTGAVHTAPAHGQEDYVVGQKQGLTCENPLDNRGVFKAKVPHVAGLHVYRADEAVIGLLKQRNALLAVQKINHSYPHCWRHKTPLIFCATPQWFISMTQSGLRQRALAAIETVKWSPAWAKARMQMMIEKRPDWCISRQRLWGTPMALFIHKETHALHPDTPALLEKVAQQVARSGIAAWYAQDTESLLGSAAKHYDKSTDTLDVWFDSGATHACVLAENSTLGFPAQLYLEGSDQYRGWFQSSLLTAVAIAGQSPYQMALSHGFVLDMKGEKMSKSLGNTVAPEKICQTLGADILRLWVASSDFRGEPRISDEILKRVSEAYRRMRNTVRFLIANLWDFDPQKQQLPQKQLLGLDRWAMYLAKKVQDTVLKAYQDFEFHHVCRAVQGFCTVDMGGFYLDIIKDRQYTTPKDSDARRSCQTAMYHILQAMVRWLAPVLSFTAEEIWQHLPWKAQDSVFLTRWHKDPLFDSITLEAPFDVHFWDFIMQVREAVNKRLEAARSSGEIGSGLDAKVVIICNQSSAYDKLKLLNDELRFVLITSEVTVQYVSGSNNAADCAHSENAIGEIRIVPVLHPKCARCWHKTPSVGKAADYPDICTRCARNISGTGETRKYA